MKQRKIFGKDNGITFRNNKEQKKFKLYLLLSNVIYLSVPIKLVLGKHITNFLARLSYILIDSCSPTKCPMLVVIYILVHEALHSSNYQDIYKMT